MKVPSMAALARTQLEPSTGKDGNPCVRKYHKATSCPFGLVIAVRAGVARFALFVHPPAMPHVRKTTKLATTTQHERKTRWEPSVQPTPRNQA